MAEVKTDISLNDSLLEQVETLAQEMKISRSQVFALAAQDFIHRHQNQRLTEQLNEAYKDGPDEEERQWLLHARQSYGRILEKDEW